MAYYPDLSRFTDHRENFDFGDRVLNVGWLSSDYEFKKAAFSENPLYSQFLDHLAMYVERPVIVYRSYRKCVFCGMGARAILRETHQGRELVLGHRISLIFGEGDKVFVSPILIFHYVVAHNYQPPDEFIQAVLTQPLPDTPEYLVRLQAVSPRWAIDFMR
jgi:hypothetical protein